MTLFVQIILPAPALTLFNIYSNVDSFVNAMAVNVPVASLLTGVAISNAPEGTTTVRVLAIGNVCRTHVDTTVNPPA